MIAASPSARLCQRAWRTVRWSPPLLDLGANLNLEAAYKIYASWLKTYSKWRATRNRSAVVHGLISVLPPHRQHRPSNVYLMKEHTYLVSPICAQWWALLSRYTMWTFQARSTLAEMAINRHQEAAVGRPLQSRHMTGWMWQLVLIVRIYLPLLDPCAGLRTLIATCSARITAQANGRFSLRPSIAAIDRCGMWSGVP